jgi:hypothetical protein
MWLLGAALTAIFVPRRRLRLFIVAFLAAQMAVWIAAAVLLELGLIAYPIREFPRATNMGFTMEYMMYPVLCGLYIIYEPQRGWGKRALYLLAWSCGLGLFQYWLTAGTELVEYVHLNWIVAGFTFACILIATKGIVGWYRRSPAIPGGWGDV